MCQEFESKVLRYHWINQLGTVLLDGLQGTYYAKLTYSAALVRTFAYLEGPPPTHP